MDKRPIGYLDSGVGGLTALKEGSKILPSENTIYLADQANLPYGTKSKPEVIALSRKMLNFLQEKNVKAVVIACNTISALALTTLKEEFTIPLFGVIDAGSKKALSETINKEILVLGTNATIKSKKYDETLLKLDPNVKVSSLATQDLVTIVEAGDFTSPAVLKKIEKILEPIKSSTADTLILGCTHFPFIKKQIDDITHHRFKIIDSGKAAILTLNNYLTKNELLNNYDKVSTHNFFTTGDPQKFDQMAQLFLNKNKINSQHLELK